MTIFDFIFTLPLADVPYFGGALRQGSGRRNAAGGLDDWEVKIADFVPSTAKASTRHVGFVGERCENGSWCVKFTRQKVVYIEIKNGSTNS